MKIKKTIAGVRSTGLDNGRLIKPEPISLNRIQGASMVVVLAKIKAKQGKEAQLEQAIRDIIPEVAKEAGTLTYILHKAQNDPTRFMFFEQYKDMAALGIHSSTPHFKKLSAAMKECLEGKPEIELYDELVSCSSSR